MSFTPSNSQNLSLASGLPGLLIRPIEAPLQVFYPGETDELPESELRTRTPEGSREATFSGIPLADLIDPDEYQRATILAVAANGSTTGFSLNEAVAKGAFVAYAKNGRQLTDYGQGPYRIVFPWSDNPALEIPSVYAMSVWRLVELRME